MSTIVVKKPIKVQLIACLAMLELLSVVCRKGSVHDFRILKESRIARELPETEKLADSGYQGISKLYANSSTHIKKCRSAPLAQRRSNSTGSWQHKELALRMWSDGVRFFALPKTSIEANIATMGKRGM